jgi:hypothetical protein
MRMKTKNDNNDDLRAEYEPAVFANGVRGKYYARYQSGTNLALLAPDVRAAFPTDEAVNEALRLLVKLAGQTVAPTTR